MNVSDVHMEGEQIGEAHAVLFKVRYGFGLRKMQKGCSGCGEM